MAASPFGWPVVCVFAVNHLIIVGGGAVMSESIFRCAFEYTFATFDSSHVCGFRFAKYNVHLFFVYFTPPPFPAAATRLPLQV